MSISDIAAAVIGLRETTYKDHQRLSGGLEEVQAALEAMRGSVDDVLDKRLAHAAQAFRDVERRLETEYERRLDAMLMTLIDIVDRLDTLTTTAESSEDPAELQARLRSLGAPSDRLRRILEEAGIRSFHSEGEPYHPLRHEVVQRQHVAECESEYVLEELRPGYVREGTDFTLLRARVIVASPPLSRGGSDSGDDGGLEER